MQIKKWAMIRLILKLHVRMKCDPTWTAIFEMSRFSGIWQKMLAQVRNKEWLYFERVLKMFYCYWYCCGRNSWCWFRKELQQNGCASEGTGPYESSQTHCGTRGGRGAMSRHSDTWISTLTFLCPPGSNRWDVREAFTQSHTMLPFSAYHHEFVARVTAHLNVVPVEIFWEGGSNYTLSDWTWGLTLHP